MMQTNSGKSITSAPRTSVEQSNRESVNKKAKMTYAKSTSVQGRNARERIRVKEVNVGFDNLRQLIPSDMISTLHGRDSRKKLKKVDTLRLAAEYIRSLEGLLDDNEFDTLSAISSLTSSIKPPLPPCIDSSSPTPSYLSNNSSIGHSSYDLSITSEYDAYRNEEELLDATSWWKQQ